MGSSVTVPFGSTALLNRGGVEDEVAGRISWQEHVSDSDPCLRLFID